jgi:hypothetical protein
MQLKPITAIIVLLLVVASLLVSGCITTNNTNQTPSVALSATPSIESDKTTFSSSRGYSITYPRAWARDVNESAAPSVGSSIDVYIYPNPDNKIDGLDVVTYKLDAHSGYTLQEFSDFNLKSLSTFKDYALLSFANTTVAGVPAHKVTFEATGVQISAGNIQNAPQKVTQVYLIHNGVGYLIAYKTTPSDFDKYLAQAEQVINSFKFTS